jgi:pimeloyl-ACP methyl ester carboxylesterase
VERLVLILGIAALATACDAIRDYQRATLFQPQHTHPDEAIAARIEGLERWWLEVDETSDAASPERASDEGRASTRVRVEAWYLPPLGASEARAPAVIFAHGNRELIEEWAEPLRPYREMGCAVLIPEYRSYGRSGGAPSEEAIVSDFAAFYDRLVDRREIDGDRIVFHGRSLGGGVVGSLSLQRRASALVLESTFTSIPDLASQWTAPDFFATDRFDTRAVLMGSSTPVLLIHGLEDELVPFKHARELRRVAWDARIVAFHAGHDDVPRTRGGYWRHVRRFLADANVLTSEP